MTERILVIDDDAAVRTAFELALQSEHYEVVLTDSGAAGLEAAKQTPPDLIYLDLRMPGMNGVETLLALREAGISAPLAIVTAFSDDFFHQLRLASETGAKFALLQKPLGRDKILVFTRDMLDGKIDYV